MLVHKTKPKTQNSCVYESWFSSGTELIGRMCVKRILTRLINRIQSGQSKWPSLYWEINHGGCSEHKVGFFISRNWERRQEEPQECHWPSVPTKELKKLASDVRKMWIIINIEGRYSLARDKGKQARAKSFARTSLCLGH